MERKDWLARLKENHWALTLLTFACAILSWSEFRWGQDIRDQARLILEEAARIHNAECQDFSGDNSVDDDQDDLVHI
jgi:hypothetical protein